MSAPSAEKRPAFELNIEASTGLQPARSSITISILTHRYRCAFQRGAAMKPILLIIQLALWLGLFLCVTIPAYPHATDLDGYGCL